MLGKATPRDIGFAATSVLLGVWAFIKVNSISGPEFEPIMAACTNADYSNMDDFVSKTGYHAYEPMVGLKVFNFLVCLITQFLWQLRQTYPAGFLTWGGIVLVSLAVTPLVTVEAGRKGARGIVYYPMVFGLLGQLLGISVVFPLIFVPGFILGRGTGPVSSYRAIASIPLNIPVIFLTAIVFGADTDSYLWTISAGILGGPLLVLASAVLWTDVTPVADEKTVKMSISLVKQAFFVVTCLGVIGWYTALYVVYQSYGSAGGFVEIIQAIWDEIWVNANGSVRFMTIDTGVFYLGALLLIAHLDVLKALKAVALVPMMGAAGASLVLSELEETRYAEEDGQKDKEA